MGFEKGKSGNAAGRPKGTKNKASYIDESTKADAKSQLAEAVKSGEEWAIKVVIERCAPKLKPVTPEDSLDGQMLKLKILEITEIAERLAELEKIVDGDKW
ncbi:DUF5681 domain-containing protein [Vibrio breoganii]